MNIKRFTNIIKRNSIYEDEVEKNIDDFFETICINGDMTKLIKEVGSALDILVFNIPMKIDTIGAVSYKTNYSKYILLNSNQPRCKMYFAFYHDIYHVLNGASNIINEQKEVHFNEDYLSDENECKANLFAASVLMPKNTFKRIFKIYNEKETDLKITIFKLMNYFNSPYIAVLLRLFELNLIKDLSYVNDYLTLKEEDLFDEFKENGISDDILKPTFDDDSACLYKLIKSDAEKLISKNLLSEAKYNRLLVRIDNFIKDIRIDTKND